MVCIYSIWFVCAWVTSSCPWFCSFPFHVSELQTITPSDPCIQAHCDDYYWHFAKPDSTGLKSIICSLFWPCTFLRYYRQSLILQNPSSQYQSILSIRLWLSQKWTMLFQIELLVWLTYTILFLFLLWTTVLFFVLHIVSSGPSNIVVLSCWKLVFSNKKDHSTHTPNQFVIYQWVTCTLRHVHRPLVLLTTHQTLKSFYNALKCHFKRIFLVKSYFLLKHVGEYTCGAIGKQGSLWGFPEYFGTTVLAEQFQRHFYRVKCRFSLKF